MTKNWGIPPEGWRVGESAKWIGRVSKPHGATSNPPSPCWWPSPEQLAMQAKVCRNIHVEILEIRYDGYPTLVRADDGAVFDPSVDIARLVKVSHVGWKHPDPRRGP